MSEKVKDSIKKTAKAVGFAALLGTTVLTSAGLVELEQKYKDNKATKEMFIDDCIDNGCSPQEIKSHVKESMIEYKEVKKSISVRYPSLENKSKVAKKVVSTAHNNKYSQEKENN